ncbi:MAG: energy transducer TonB [Acidobacteriota bacterium]
MYFNFDDRQPETPGLERAMSWREGLLLSIVAHVVAGLALVFVPQLLPAQRLEVSELEREAALARERERNARRFVFVQPRAEFEAKQPPRLPELSDRDRSMRSPESRPNPANPLPFSRGNTQERVDIPGAGERPMPPQPQPPRAGNTPQLQQGGESVGADGQPGESLLLRGLRGPSPRDANAGSSGLGDRLGEALRNVSQYYSPEQIFDNAQGGGEFGSAIQFDTKGVEFGPWIRRFIAQIKRNWFIPYAAMSLRGRVVVTFNVWKDGRITDLQVVGPCPVDAFNNSSFNALAASTPTQPLPPEYPADRAFFTVTFYYNETPPGR